MHTHTIIFSTHATLVRGWGEGWGLGVGAGGGGAAAVLHSDHMLRSSTAQLQLPKDGSHTAVVWFQSQTGIPDQDGGAPTADLIYDHTPVMSATPE